MDQLPEVQSNSSIVRAIQAMETRRTVRRRPWYTHQAVFGVGGLLLGIGATLFFQDNVLPKHALAKSESHGTAAQQLAGLTPEETWHKYLKQAEDVRLATPPAVSVQEKPQATVEPTLTEPPKREITGHIRASEFSMPDVQALPAVMPSSLHVKPVIPSNTEDIQREQKADLVTVDQETDTPDETVEAIKQIAHKLGGGAQRYSDSNGDGVIAFVPPGKVQNLIDLASARGLAVKQQSWSGAAESRQQKLAEDAERRLGELRKKRDELLISFYEDAQPVKQVDEDIAKAEDELKKAKALKNPADKAMVRIRFTAKG